MKAILTKYMGPTNTRPSRVKAYDSDGNSIVVNFDTNSNSPAVKDTLARMPENAFSGDVSHYRAAYALIDKMNWPGKLIGGGIKGGMAFVFAEIVQIDEGDQCPECGQQLKAICGNESYLECDCCDEMVSRFGTAVEKAEGK